MRQVLGPDALGRPRGIGWRGRWEGGLGWRIHVYPWLIHVNVWQKPLQYCKVISLQPIKKKKFSASIIVNKPLVEAWSERWQGRLGGGGPCLPLQAGQFPSGRQCPHCSLRQWACPIREKGQCGISYSKTTLVFSNSCSGVGVYVFIP